MSVFHGISQEQLEMVGRMDTALRAVAAIVVPDPVFAAAGMMGVALQMMHARGMTEEEVIEQVSRWFAQFPGLHAEAMRRQMRVVPDEPPPAGDREP